jgi:uncharacterized protein YPO0396
MLKRLTAGLILFPIVALAQQPSPEQAARAITKSLSAAQEAILTIPDLMSERDALKAKVQELQSELDKLKKPAEPPAKQEK